jgi:hypothetical protein
MEDCNRLNDLGDLSTFLGVKHPNGTNRKTAIELFQVII